MAISRVGNFLFVILFSFLISIDGILMDLPGVPAPSTLIASSDTRRFHVAALDFFPIVNSFTKLKCCGAGRSCITLVGPEP
jgi:hypothetical protein